MKISNLVSSIGWRPIASYFFLIVVIFVAVKFYAVPQNAMGAVLLSLPFAVFMAWIFFKRLLIPLWEINEAAREMARGNLDNEISICSNEQIGDLARNINYLARRLKSTIDEITEEKDRMRAVLNSMADGVVAVNSHGSVLLINPVVERVLKISERSSKGKDIVGILRHYDFERHLKTALESQQELSKEIQVPSEGRIGNRVKISNVPGTVIGEPMQ